MAKTDKDIDTASDVSQQSQDRRENTRTRIAVVYVAGFLSVVVIALLVGLFKLQPSDTKDLLVTISGILSGPLGFIIGYYFKAAKE